MASTDLMTYLNYMATWDSESDGNIDNIITEQNLFLQVGDYDSDHVVNNEFDTLYDLEHAWKLKYHDKFIMYRTKTGYRYDFDRYRSANFGYRLLARPYPG